MRRTPITTTPRHQPQWSAKAESKSNTNCCSTFRTLTNSQQIEALSLNTKPRFHRRAARELNWIKLTCYDPVQPWRNIDLLCTVYIDPPRTWSHEWPPCIRLLVLFILSLFVRYLNGMRPNCLSLVLALSVSGHGLDLGLGFAALPLAFNILALTWIAWPHDSSILVFCVLKLVCTPVSSAPLERVFSRGKLHQNINELELGCLTLTRCWNHLFYVQHVVLISCTVRK